MSQCNHMLGYWNDGCSHALVEKGSNGLDWHLSLVVTEGELFKFCPRCGEQIPQPPEGCIPNVAWMDAEIRPQG